MAVPCNTTRLGKQRRPAAQLDRKETPPSRQRQTPQRPLPPLQKPSACTLKQARAGRQAGGPRGGGARLEQLLRVAMLLPLPLHLGQLLLQRGRNRLLRLRGGHARRGRQAWSWAPRRVAAERAFNALCRRADTLSTRSVCSDMEAAAPAAGQDVAAWGRASTRAQDAQRQQSWAAVPVCCPGRKDRRRVRPAR